MFVRLLLMLGEGIHLLLHALDIEKNAALQSCVAIYYYLDALRFVDLFDEKCSDIDLKVSESFIRFKDQNKERLNTLAGEYMNKNLMKYSIMWKNENPLIQREKLLNRTNIQKKILKNFQIYTIEESWIISFIKSILIFQKIIANKLSYFLSLNLFDRRFLRFNNAWRFQF